MKDLLLNIAGLSSENLTTEVLRIILTEKGYEIYQKAFYQHILKKQNISFIEPVTFDIESQVRFCEGQPDLIISNDNSVIIIENKFYAKFSGDDQISRYIELINKHYQKCSVKLIYILTINRQKKTYEDILNKELIHNNFQAQGIEINYIIWEELLEIFRSNNFLVNALEEYISKNYLKQITFSPEGKKMLLDKEFPQTLQNLYDTVDKIKNDIQNMGMVTGRLGQSYNYYGFNVTYNKIKIWFGYALSWWLANDEIKTPFYIQIQEIWNQNILFDDDFNNKLKSLGFTHYPDIQWTKPIPISFEVQDVLIAEKVVNIIKNLID